MHFSGSYNFNILFRWVYEGVLSIALFVSGSELIRKNQDIDFLDIRKRKPLRMRYSGVIFWAIIAFIMIFFMTRPAYEITNHIVTTAEEQMGVSDTLNEDQPENNYTENGDLTVEEKIRQAHFYSYLGGVFSIIGIVMLFVVIIPCNLIFREINEEIKSPVTDLRIRTPKELPPKSKKQKRVYDIDKPAVRINHPAIHAMKTILNLDELEKLSSENCEFDIVSANELAKIEMDMLSEVHLDDNDIGKMKVGWLSRRVKEFTCCRCNLKTADGLGNSMSLLESFDCRENDLESIDFLSHSNESLRCAKLSYNYFTPEAIERALEGCCKLEELDIGFNKSALNSEQNEMFDDYIESIVFLRPFDHLRSLSIVDADLEDLDPLKNKNLEKLRLAYCGIEDISALSDSVLSSQAYLDLEGNHISDISFLPKIYYNALNISNNDINDFSHLLELCGKHIIIPDNGSDDFFEQLKNLHQFEHVTILGIPLWRQNKAERILQRLSSLDKIEVTMTEENPLPDDFEEGSPEYCSAYHETYLRISDSWEEK